MKIIYILPFVAAFSGYFLTNFFLKSKAFPAPNLIGLSLHQALKNSKEFNISIKLLDEEENNNFKPETIIYQNPCPEAFIKERQTIYIIICKQKQNLPFEKLTLRKLDSLEKWLKNNEIKANLYNVYNPNVSKNVCIGQNIQAGDTNYDKKNVIIYIAQNHEQIVIPSFINRNSLEVVEFLKLYNLKFKTNKKAANKSIVTEQKPLAYSIYNLKDLPEINLNFN